MSLTKHIGLRRIGVILFLSLNCLLAALPFVSASTLPASQSVPAGYISQNHGSSDTEENSRPVNASDDRYEYHYSNKNKQRQLHSPHSIACGHCLKAIVRLRTSDHGGISSAFPLMPGYYSLLFLYQLF